MIRLVPWSCNPSHVLRTRERKQDKQLEQAHSHWCTSLSPQLWRPFCQAGWNRTKVALKVMLWAFRSLHIDVQLKLPISLPIGCNRFDWFVINSSYWRAEQDGWRHRLSSWHTTPEHRPLGPGYWYSPQFSWRKEHSGELLWRWRGGNMRHTRRQWPDLRKTELYQKSYKFLKAFLRTAFFFKLLIE